MAQGRQVLIDSLDSDSGNSPRNIVAQRFPALKDHCFWIAFR